MASHGWQSRFIIDPLVSILITTAILFCALPLVRQTSRILLQATPNHLSYAVIKRALLLIPGVEGVHEFHMWQLSDSKTVASVHVRVAADRDLVDTVRTVKHVLCGFGVCASTIQPEQAKHNSDCDDTCTLHEGTGCMIRCVRESCRDNACCSEERVQLEASERVTYGTFWYGYDTKPNRPAAAPGGRGAKRRGSRRVSSQLEENRTSRLFIRRASDYMRPEDFA